MNRKTPEEIASRMEKNIELKNLENPLDRI
jgi:hypothetical protein